MSIASPYGLLLALFVLLLGVIGCIYLILRSLRMMRGGGKQSEDASPTSWSKKLRDWMSEPVSSAKSPPAPVSDMPSPLVPDRLVPAAPPLEKVEKVEKGGLEVMRVLRVGALGELVVEVKGERYRKLVEIRDGTVGRRILLAIQELNEFAGSHAQRPLPEMQRIDSSGAQGAEPTAAQQAFLAQLQEPKVDEEPEPPKSGLVDYWRRGLSRSRRQEAAKVAEQEPKSFIDELEEMLQLRLAGRAEMDSRSVHFKSTPTVELRIEVDGGHYESIDDVPYPDVKSLLKATIRAWELG